MIRRLEEKDYAVAKKLTMQIHNLHKQNRQDIYKDANPLPKEYFCEIVNDEKAVNLVYVEDKKVVGLLLAMQKTSSPYPIMKKRKFYFIDNIVVDENYRRKGIAKKLYQKLEEIAIEEKMDSICLNVWAFNENAINFYEDMGMSAQSMKMEKFLKKDNVKTKNIKLKITSKVEK